MAKAKRHLEKAYRYKEGAIIFSVGEGYKHFRKKCEIAWKLKELGYHFVTEARFQYNAGRADIYVLDNGGIAIEIINTENFKSLQSKMARYPIPLVSIGVNERFEEELIL